MHKTKNKSIVLLLLSIFCGILVFGYFRYNSYIQNPIDPSDNTDISFQIEKGQTAKEIADKLEEKELIKNPLSFYIYVRIHNLGKDIISGRFLLNKTMNTPEIIKTISDPKKAEAILTIQEGLTINDIEQKLIKLNLAEKGKVINEVKNFVGWEYYDFLDQKTLKNLELPLEGYL
ncbi:hypothetical protein GF366_01880, partial [Candidatus Peregrinibacteria bacterium]|nr:hypothetical protein [Candidatus Peregrinibacteria bacterium]